MRSAPPATRDRWAEAGGGKVSVDFGTVVGHHEIIGHNPAVDDGEDDRKRDGLVGDFDRNSRR